MRHPRCLSACIIANSLFSNYAGLFILILLLVLLGYGMIVLEEGELIDRFGEAYREYQRQVRRLIPPLAENRWRIMPNPLQPTTEKRGG